MGYKNLSISLPDELVSMVAGVQKREHRSRSEVMREALRLFFEQRGLIEDPRPGELEAVEEARAEDEYVTLAEARRELDLPRR